jgi:hypothetical protein
VVREAYAQLLEEGFLLGSGLGDSAQTDLMTVGGGQDNVRAL